MNTSIKSFLLNISIITLLSACSTSSLQTKRLDTAENLIIQAEQTLSSPSGQKYKQQINEDLGTANAYLATLNDYKKSLNKAEIERYKALKRRSNVLMQRVK